MDRTETEQQTRKPALNDKCCLFLWIYLFSNPNPQKILQLDFLFYPLLQLYQLFLFKLAQNTFWMAFLGIALIFLLG